MVTAVRSLGLQGISGYEVTVECFLSGGLPAFDIVGLGDTAVKESRERVRAAVKNCGVKFPVSRITVNLAPAGRKKEGTLYDLPILLGILASAEEIKPPAKDAAFVGELSLTGTLRAVNGVFLSDADKHKKDNNRNQNRNCKTKQKKQCFSSARRSFRKVYLPSVLLCRLCLTYILFFCNFSNFSAIH